MSFRCHFADKGDCNRVFKDKAAMYNHCTGSHTNRFLKKVRKPKMNLQFTFWKFFIELVREWNNDNVDDKITVYWCPVKECGNGYHKKSMFDLHIKRHGNKDIKCSNAPACDKKFFYERDMKRHLKNCKFSNQDW